MEKQLRILHVIDSLKIGGTERQCVEIAKRINGGKYNVQLVTLEKKGALLQAVIDAQIPLTEFKISGAFYQPKSILQIIRLALFMKKKKFHIVQTYGFYSTVPGVIAARIARVPVVISGKRDMNELLSRGKIRVEKFLWKFCDKIIVNAKRIQDYLITKENIPIGKIKVIYNVVDIKNEMKTSEMRCHSKINIVGMVANFREQKDHKTFLDAAVIVRKMKPDVRFALVGSGPLEDKVKGLANDLGLFESITFHGWKSGKELFDVMGTFSITVLSSFNEGMPNVILESMALGIPVIANPSGGVPELIEDGVSGYLFQYKRPDILAEKINYLLDNKNILLEIGYRAREIVKSRFSSQQTIKSFKSLYVELLSSKFPEIYNNF